MLKLLDGESFKPLLHIDLNKSEDADHRRDISNLRLRFDQHVNLVVGGLLNNAAPLATSASGPHYQLEGAELPNVAIG